MHTTNASKGRSLHKGWYSRGYLPHCDAADLLQFVTFRLADSLPQNFLRRLESELSLGWEREMTAERTAYIDAHLDAGMGACALGKDEMAEVMSAALRYHDGTRYRLDSWTIMPNHVHVIVAARQPIGQIVGGWKKFTAKWANENNARLGLGVVGGCLWMREYWDRYIRSEQHLRFCRKYVETNPVKAGLCGRPEEWRWGSAFKGVDAGFGNAKAQRQAGQETGGP